MKQVPGEFILGKQKGRFTETKSLFKKSEAVSQETASLHLA